MTFRDFDIENVNKLTTPTDYVTLKDGRQVLILNENIYDFLYRNSVINN